MNDQAGSLRQMVESQKRRTLPRRADTERGSPGEGTGLLGEGTGLLSGLEQDGGRILAITSGKGGVGKTNLAVNLAISLSMLGRRVTLLDADIGLGNVDTLLGISAQWGLGHVLSGDRSLDEVVVEGPKGVRIMPGGSGLAHFARRRDLLGNVQRLMAGFGDDPDILIVDTGAGLTDNVMAFLKAADRVLVVTTPEPTAITDAYATIKVTGQENPQADIGVVANMVSGESEARTVVAKLNLVVTRFLDIHIENAGYVVRDPAVGRAVLAQKPFTLAYPNAPASRCVRAVASRISTEIGKYAAEMGGQAAVGGRVSVSDRAIAGDRVAIGGGATIDGRAAGNRALKGGAAEEAGIMRDAQMRLPQRGGGFGRLLRRLFAS